MIRLTPSIRERIDYGSKAFKELQKKHSSVERVFSRLLSISMQDLPVSGMQAVKNYCTIAHITVLLIALATNRAGYSDKIRFVRSFVPNLSKTFTTSQSYLTLVLGKTIAGESFAADLAKMPHLLVAGATGSGKSVSLNSMILSILFKATPAHVRFLMIDLKMLELSFYEGIPHLLLPVVTNAKNAKTALRWMTDEMERRYGMMAQKGVRNIEKYNHKIAREDGEQLPYIVVVIDELADLMMTSPKEVEEYIARLAQMARASGIHLILATQRPSVDVLTGIIKANFPARVACKVFSKVDSRTILDTNGAESLLGYGDMLFLSPGIGRLARYLDHTSTISAVSVHGREV